MGLLGYSQSGGCFGALMRRKQVDSDHESSNALARELSVPHLIAIGVGSTIGAGVYILVGTVARENSGPALTISFLIAGIAAALSALCYAELASRCPSAGSAYHYSYICVGECVAWLVGWALILEYAISASAVARGISPNLALLFGGGSGLPDLLGHVYVSWLDIFVDPGAFIVVIIVTGLLCVGIKESALAQGIVTMVNICVMIFVIVAGCYMGFKTGWEGYRLSIGYFPFGIDGVLAGSAIVFFSYIGFDSVASAAEEAKNPQRDMPLGIVATLLISCSLYMLVSIVIVGLIPYYAMDPDTPISTAFSSHGMRWAAYTIAIGAITALCATLMGSLLPQPRILMAMARDGLLPPFFSDVNKHTQIPVKGTVVTGMLAGTLAFFMDVSELAGMVSVGTLLAFTTVAVSVLILRYVPPDEMPFSSFSQEPLDADMLKFPRTSHDINGRKSNVSVEDPLIVKEGDQGILRESKRRQIAGWAIMFICVGAFFLAYAASDTRLSRATLFSLCGTGGALLLIGLVVLSCINQNDARHGFGHPGGFICPFVPLIPIACILINIYLLINLGADTWARVSVWLVMGALVYVFYGWTHSSLRGAVSTPPAHVDQISRSSACSLP